MAIRGAAVTPVLQNHGQTGVITPSKRRGLFPRTPLRGEQQLEAPLLSLAAAEEALHGMESGSVLIFINNEPSQSQSRGGGVGNSRTARHQLFISFKYRRSMIHFDFYWVHLKNVCRDPRRSVFHTEQKHFDIVHELFVSFVPMIRAWLAAIVKVANFIDQPVESVDLRQMLRMRHHLVLPRSTAVSASVVLCKLDPEMKKIVSTSITFDFKARRIRDDSGSPLRSFHDVFQMFLGLHPGHAHPLMPSPREEDEEEPQLALSLLEGLDAESDSEVKLQRLLRLQGIMRKELAHRQNGDTTFASGISGNTNGEGSARSRLENLELLTTLLLPQLVHSAPPPGTLGTVPSGGMNASVATLNAADAAGGAMGTFGGGAAATSGEISPESFFSKSQIIVCDILADMCDAHTDGMGPHIWRMCRGYLEEPSNWHMCLAALELLTLLSPKLTEWLVFNTDVATRLCSMLIEAQQYLCSHREAALAAIGRAPQPAQPPRQWPPPRAPTAGDGGHIGNSIGGPRLLGRVKEEWGSPQAPSVSSEPPGEPPRRAPPPLPQTPDHDLASVTSAVVSAASAVEAGSGRWGDPRRGAPPPLPLPLERSRSSGTLAVGTSRVQPPPQPPCPRPPSFDNFEATPGSGRCDGAGSRRSSFDGSFPHSSVGRRRQSYEPAEGGDGKLGALFAGSAFAIKGGVAGVGVGTSAGLGGGSGSGGVVSTADSRSARPMRVPPLNLDLASRLPNAGPQDPGNLSQEVAAKSMSRHSRRHRQREGKERITNTPTISGPSSGNASCSTLGAPLRSPNSIADSFFATLNNSAPSLGRLLSGCSLAQGNVPAGSANSTGNLKGFQPEGPSEKLAIQQAEEVSKAFGEATLLADLSCILKYRQERQVVEMVMDSMRPTSETSGSASPVKSSSRSPTPRTGCAGGTPAKPTSMVVPTSGGRSTVPSSPATSNSHRQIASSTTASIGPGCPSPSPRDPRARLLALRRVRVHTALILGRLGACAPWALKLVGPHVPVNKLFEMLQASCARSGACSFVVDDDGDSDEVCIQDTRPAFRGVLQQRITPARQHRMSWLCEQLRKSNAVKKCICGASAALRGGAEDFCTCVDDVLVGCIWRLLGAYARHVEDLHLGRTLAPFRAIGATADGGTSACRMGAQALGSVIQPRDVWGDVPNTWRVRDGLDTFVTRLSRALVQALLQLKSAHCATTAGPEAVSSLQHRVAFILRICSAYVRRCHCRALPLQMFEVLRPAVVGVKLHLCSSAESTGVNLLSAPALRLWVAYLQFVGVLLRVCVRGRGLHCPVLAEALVVNFLDFAPCSVSPLAVDPGASSRAVYPSQPSGRSAGPASAGVPSDPVSGMVSVGSLAQMPTVPSAGSGAAEKRQPQRSHSSRTLHGNAGNGSFGSLAPPMRLLPSTAAPSAEGASASGVTQQGPRAAAMGTQPRGTPPRETTARACMILPRILERVLCEAGFDDASGSSAAKPRSAVGDESGDAMRCRILAFVEALLQVGEALGPAPRAATADGHGSTNSEPLAAISQAPDETPIQRCGLRRPDHIPAEASRLGLVSVQDGFRSQSETISEALTHSILDWLQFLLMPPTGLLCHLARKLPLVGGPIVNRLVLCERALYKVPAVAETVYAREAHVSEYYVRRHFLNFVRLYNSHGSDAASNTQLRRLCCLHLETLLGIASLQSVADLPRRAFHRLSVLDFLAGEIDLEHETTQMRDRFLRQARQAGPSCFTTVSSGSYSTISGPPSTLVSSGAGGRGGMTTLASPPRVHAPPGEVAPPASADPQLPSSQVPAIGTSAAAFASTRVGAPSVSEAGSGVATPTETPAAAPVSSNLGLPARLVPKLKFGGLRPSMQGCSGLGAPPPEEPGFEDGGGLDSLKSQVNAPKLSIVELSERGEGVGLASVGEPDDSSTGSTAASPANWQQRQDQSHPTLANYEAESASMDEDTMSSADAAPVRRPVVPKLSMPCYGSSGAAQQPPGGVGRADATFASLGTSPATSRSPVDDSARLDVAEFQQQQQRLAAMVPMAATRSVIPEAAKLGEVAPPHGGSFDAAGQLTPDSSDVSEPSKPLASGVGAEGSEMHVQASAPTVTSVQPFMPLAVRRGVPKLKIGGLRPCLQGCSGIGAPPPEEPGIDQASFERQLPPPAVEGALAPPPLSPLPPSDSDSDSEYEASKQQPAPTSAFVAPEAAALVLAPSDAVETALVDPQEADTMDDQDQTDVRSHRSYGSSSSSAPSGPCSAGAPRPQWPANSPVPMASDVRGEEPAPIGPAPPARHLLEDARTPELPPGPMLGTSPIPPTMPSAGLALGRPPATLRMSRVPKLTLRGLRPSLQGCTGLGAPPPEEPGIGDQQNTALPPSTAQQQGFSAPTAVPFSGTNSPMVGGASGDRPMWSAGSLPTGVHSESGYRSPVAGSVVSMPVGDVGSDLSCVGIIHENIFYFKGRQRRPLYEDVHLHSLMLTLILALMTTPKKGLLDTRYCEQYPLANHKRNIPFLLHLHLNHSANRAVLPWLSQQVEQLSHIGVFRLLKLLCQTAMHRWMYANWSRIAGGQFGTVYLCGVQLSETGHVAVKQIPKQNNIQDRCVFFDVFSEVACLDAVRFEKNVCQIFDYGVDETSYWIVMKYYSTTVKRWRESIRGSMSDNLPVLLAVYRQILLAVYTLHWHGVVHYDLKCDNIMIDFDRGESAPRVQLCDSALEDTRETPRGQAGDLHRGVSSAWAPLAVREEEEDSPEGREDSSEPESFSKERVAFGEVLAPCIAIADFGESRMFAEAGELDVRNRGTELIKCPEMLEIENFGRKDGQNFDRRKRVGTDQTADMWSLGCLLFELLTGRFLYEDDDIASFFARVTGKMGTSVDSDVVSQANCELLENNTPLLELMRYMLVRNPLRRPSIDAVMTRFEAAAQEAVKAASDRFCSNRDKPSSISGISACDSSGIGTPDTPRSVARSVGGSSGGGPHSHSRAGGRPDRPLQCLSAAGEGESYFTKVLQDVSILETGDEDFCLLAGGADPRCAAGPVDTIARGLSMSGGSNGQHGGIEWGSLRSRLSHSMWTHIVDCRSPGAVQLPGQLDVSHVLALPWSSSSRAGEELIDFMPMIFDFLRHAAISRGVVLLVDGLASSSSVPERSGDVLGQPADDAAVGSLGLGGDGSRGGLAMTVVLALIAEHCHMVAFPALSYLSSQLLVAAIRPDAVTAVARWQETERRCVWRRCEGMARVSCLCGACSWHVPTSWLTAPVTEPHESPSQTLAAEVDSLAAEVDSVVHSAWLTSNHSRPSPRGKAAWPGPGSCVASCTCNPTSASMGVNPRCPSRGTCESYVRWLRARFGVHVAAVHWLWLPEGCTASEYADNAKSGALTCDLSSCSEPVGESTRESATQSTGGASAPQSAQRFRCRWCQVLTHAEVPSTTAATTAGPQPRIALVLSYELLRWAAAANEQGHSGAAGAETAQFANAVLKKLDTSLRRPPSRLHETSLEEVLLPRAQPVMRNVVCPQEGTWAPQSGRSCR